MALTPGLGAHLRGLADEVLVHDFPGATIRPGRAGDAGHGDLAGETTGSSAWTRTERSQTALLEDRGAGDLVPLIDTVKLGSSEGFEPKMQALLHVARTVRRDPLALTERDVRPPTRRARPTATSSSRC
jgi:hypothetical protein